MKTGTGVAWGEARDQIYKQKQDDIVKRIQSNMLKSEQLDRLMVQ